MKLKNTIINWQSEGWGMGIFLIFFSDDQNDNNPTSKKKPPIINFNPFFSLRRTNSTTLVYISCALLLFTILLLFSVSTLPSASQPIRRQLNGISTSSPPTQALQRMGTLYRRGTRAMNDLIVAHAVESLTLHELKLFLRLLHRSGTTSRSDVLFVFPSKSAFFDRAIREENDYFAKLLNLYKHKKVNVSSSFSSFEPASHFVKKKQTGEPIWGRRIRSNFSDEDGLSYGSVIGFEAEELDPERSLSGFLDHVPMSLRRWACYPMLLGRVRRNFKNVALVDMKEMLLVDDPFDKITSSTAQSVMLMITQSKHGRKKPVNPTAIIGGVRGVRRLSNVLLTEIVRASMQKKTRKYSVTESMVLNQLVDNQLLLLKNNNVELILSADWIPELSSMVGSTFSTSKSKHGMVRRGSGNWDVYSIAIMNHICSFPLDSTVYNDC